MRSSKISVFSSRSVFPSTTSRSMAMICRSVMTSPLLPLESRRSSTPYTTFSMVAFCRNLPMASRNICRMLSPLSMIFTTINKFFLIKNPMRFLLLLKFRISTILIMPKLNSSYTSILVRKCVKSVMQSLTATSESPSSL